MLLYSGIAVNSLIILDAFADQVQLGVERHRQKLRPLFSVYLEE